MARPSASYHAFMRDQVVLYKTLVCPTRLFYEEYERYCQRYGFEVSSAAEVVAWLCKEEGVVIREAGRGKFRRAFEGIGLRAEEKIA